MACWVAVIRCVLAGSKGIVPHCPVTRWLERRKLHHRISVIVSKECPLMDRRVLLSEVNRRRVGGLPVLLVRIKPTPASTIQQTIVIQRMVALIVLVFASLRVLVLQRNPNLGVRRERCV
jgi:hypothetical protein